MYIYNVHTFNTLYCVLCLCVTIAGISANQRVVIRLRMLVLYHEMSLYHSVIFIPIHERVLSFALYMHVPVSEVCEL